jgi:predicted DNA-binding transcriptional regulator AlpA
MSTPDNSSTPGAAAREKMGLLTQEELAHMLGNKVSTLRDWRRDNEGPLFVRLGKGVYYRIADVQKWIDENVQLTKGGAGAMIGALLAHANDFSFLY